MRVGTVKEVKRHEYRVGLIPSDVLNYCQRGHEVYLQKDAGVGAGFSTEEYEKQGALVVETAEEVFEACDMVVKVKEPQPSEYTLFRERQILYTYLHLAAAGELTRVLMEKGVQAVAYETIEEGGRLPCLIPMSEIAGRLSIQEGAKYLERSFGGRGILLGGVPGVKRGKVGIIGGGIVGINAAKMAVGMGAQVTVLDISGERLAYLDDLFEGRITTLYSTNSNLEDIFRRSDLIIGAVLIPGAHAPRLITRASLRMMKKGAVIVDVAVDQGGCAETTRATTHDNPVYEVDGVIHYCVTNMPGVVSRTSTVALTNTTLKYGLLIADHGLEKACSLSEPLKKGVNVMRGKCLHKGIAKTVGVEASRWDEVLS